MLGIFKKWFSKNDEDMAMRLPKAEQAKFILTVDNIEVGILNCQEGEWMFKYTEEFKKHTDMYKLIVGFPDVNKEYRSDTLWPFFRIRIPGLKQPAIKEILEKESIDKENEAALLVRFGRKTIANPYELYLNS